MSTNTAWAGGATSKSVHLEGFTSSTGAPYTAGAYNTSGITAKYRRHGANAEVAITLATQTANGSYSSGGFVHVSGGRYRLDIPDAAIAAGSDYVDIWVYGITDTFFKTAHIDILGADPRAASADANLVTINGQTASASGTVTFPGTIASSTNITGGTITTVTNLTNAPTNGDLTSTMKTSVTTAATAATPTAAAVTATVNADVKKVNGVTVNGDGAGTPWGP